MNTNPPRSPGGAPPNVVTFLSQLDGTAVSVGPPPGGPPTPDVLLTAQRPGREPAVLRLAPDEADRLAELLSAAAGPAAAPPSLPTDRGDVDRQPTVRSRHVVCIAEGSAAGDLRHALALLPARSRLVDFTSDADVVLVFATDDPRWPVVARPAR